MGLLTLYEKLGELLGPENVLKVITAFSHEPLIWEAIGDEKFQASLFKKLGNDPTAWNADFICFAKTGMSRQEAENWLREPSKPLMIGVLPRKTALEAYQSFEAGNRQLESVAELTAVLAGFIYTLHAQPGHLKTFLQQYREQKELLPDRMRLMVAAYGILPDRGKFLAEVTTILPPAEIIELLVQIHLVNPMLGDIFGDSLKESLGYLPLAQQVELLKRLYQTYRQEEIAPAAALLLKTSYSETPPVNLDDFAGVERTRLLGDLAQLADENVLALSLYENARLTAARYIEKLAIPVAEASGGDIIEQAGDVEGDPFQVKPDLAAKVLDRALRDEKQELSLTLTLHAEVIRKPMLYKKVMSAAHKQKNTALVRDLAYLTFIQSPQNAANLRELVSALVAEDDHAQAIAFGQRLIRLPEALAEDWHLQGTQLEATGKSNEARQHFQQSVELAPQNGLFRLSLAKQQLKAGEYENGIRTLTEATVISPSEPAIWQALIDAHESRGHTDHAHDLARKAVQAVPFSATLLTRLGAQYLKRGNVIAASSTLQQLLQTEPESAEQAIEAIHLLNRTGKRDAAREYAGNAYVNWPENSEVKLTYIAQLEAVAEFNQALELFNTIAAQELNLSDQLGKARLICKNYIASFNCLNEREPLHLTNTLAVLEHAYQADKENDILLLAIAELNLVKGDERHAGDLLRYLLGRTSTAGNDEAWRIHRGLALHALTNDEAEAAIVSAQTAENAAGSDLTAGMVLTYAFAAAGFDEDACRSARRVADSLPEISTQLWLAEQLASCGNADQAKEVLQIAAKSYPADKRVSLKLAEIYSTLGERTNAVILLEKLLATVQAEPALINSIGQVFIQMEEWDRALACFDLVSGQGSQAAAESGFARSALLHRSGQTEQALDLARDLNTTYPESKIIQQLLIDLLLAQGCNREALDTYQQNAAAGEEPIKQKHAASLLGAEFARRLNEPAGAKLDLAFAAYQLEDYPTAISLLGDETVKLPAYQAMRALVSHILGENIETTREIDASINRISEERVTGDDYSLRTQLAWQLLRDYDSHQLPARRQQVHLIDGLLADPLIHDSLTASIADADVRARVIEQVETLLASISKVGPASVSQLLQQTYMLQTVVPANCWLSDAYAFDQVIANLESLANKLPDHPLVNLHILDIAVAMKTKIDLANQFGDQEILAEMPAWSRLDGLLEPCLNQISKFRDADEINRLRALMLGPTDELHNPLPDDTMRVRNLVVSRSLDHLDKIGLSDIYRDHEVDTLSLTACAIFSLKSNAPEALRFSAKALERKPDDPFILYLASMAENKFGDRQNAFRYLTKAIEYWPRHQQWRSQAIAMARDLGEVEDLVKLSELQLEDNLDNKRLARELIEHYNRAGQFEKAVKLLDRLLLHNNQVPEYWLDLVNIYESIGDLETALSVSNSAINQMPNSEEMLVNKGRVLLAKNELRKAESEIEILIRMFPANKELLLLKAQLLNKLGRKNEAAQLLGKVSLAEKDPESMHLQKLKLTGELESASDARKMLNGYIQARGIPYDDSVYMMLAEVNLEAGQLDEAENAAQNALKLKPGLWRAYQILGEINQQRGAIDVAIGVYRMALEINPANAKCLHEIGRLYLSRRQYNQALQAFQQLIERFPDDVEGYVLLANVMRENRDLHGAEAMLRKASQLAPDDVKIRRQLGAIIALNLVHNS